MFLMVNIPALHLHEKHFDQKDLIIFHHTLRVLVRGEEHLDTLFVF